MIYLAIFPVILNPFSGVDCIVHSLIDKTTASGLVYIFRWLYEEDSIQMPFKKISFSCLFFLPMFAFLLCVWWEQLLETLQSHYVHHSWGAYCTLGIHYIPLPVRHEIQRPLKSPIKQLHILSHHWFRSMVKWEQRKQIQRIDSQQLL